MTLESENNLTLPDIIPVEMDLNQGLYQQLNYWNKKHNLGEQSVGSIKNWNGYFMYETRSQRFQGPLLTNLIYDHLEQPNMPPWMLSGKEDLAKKAEVFPSGQLLFDKRYTWANDITLLASLSMNRINWDGKSGNLPFWDNVVDVGDYAFRFCQAFEPDGNTLAILSMIMAPGFRKGKNSLLLLDAAKFVGKTLGVTHLIGAFRMHEPMPDAADYKNYQIAVATWKESLGHMGIELLSIEDRAILIRVDLEDFQQFQKSWKPDQWQEVSPDTWYCGEPGVWKVDQTHDHAVYEEALMWGQIPLN